MRGPGLVLSLAWTAAFATTASAATGLASVEIRQNVDLKNYIAKPAILQIVDPTDSGKPATVLVNAGILMTLISSSHVSVNAIGEYSRNTALKKEQDTWKAGLTADAKLSGDGMVPIVLGLAAFQEDRVGRTSSAKSHVLFTATGDNRTGLPNTSLVVGNGVTAVYSPYFGIETEHVVSAGVPERTFWRGVARFDVAVRIGEPTTPMAELIAGNAYRRDWEDVTSEEGRSTDFHSLAVSVYPLRSARLLGGLTISHVWGEDPSENFASQSYLQYGLAVRVKAK